jgi:hypothetical protein
MGDCTRAADTTASFDTVQWCILVYLLARSHLARALKKRHFGEIVAF